MKKRFKALLNLRLFPFLIMLMAIALISSSPSEPNPFDVSITHVPSVNYAAPQGIYLEPESSKWAYPTSPYAYTQSLIWFLHLVFESQEDDTLSFEEVEALFKREGEVLWKETFSREYLRRMEWIKGAFEMTTEYFLTKINMEEDMISREKDITSELPAGETISWVRIPFARPWFAQIDRIDMRFKVRDSKGNSGVLSHSIPITNYKQKVKLRLPFSGVWQVRAGNDLTAGHRRTGLNGLSTTGWDFMKVDPPADPGYREPILAAGDGVVVDVRNDITRVGMEKPYEPEFLKKDTDRFIDSFVSIDHGNGEYSLYAHLDKGGIVVKVGDKVKAGQAIARERLTEHGYLGLHFNLMTKGEWIEGKGLPAMFSDFERLRAGKVPVYKIKLGNPMSQWYVRHIE
jgi:hypothetical protein